MTNSDSDGDSRLLEEPQRSAAPSTPAAFRIFAHRLRLQWVALALALTASQMVLVALAGTGPSWTYRYFSYFTWDGAWYHSVLENGYTTEPAYNAGAQNNLAFFPAYPIAAALVKKLFGVSGVAALFGASAIAAFVFWWAILAALDEWNAAGALRLGVVMMLFCQPGAFYLLVPYAESLFIACLTILLWLGARADRSLPALIGAGVAGYIMSATRVVGAPLAIIPIVWLLCGITALRRPLRFAEVTHLVWRYALLAAATAGGAISYFVYCAVKFGHWDHYLRARAAGWGANNVDYSGAFSPRNFGFSAPGFGETLIAHNDASRLLLSILVALLLAMPIADVVLSRIGRVTGLRHRVPFYVAAFLLLAANLLGSTVSQGHYIGFVRYGMLTETLLLLALAHAHAHSVYRTRPIPLTLQIIFFLTCAINLAVQFQFAWGYSHGWLVA